MTACQFSTNAVIDSNLHIKVITISIILKKIPKSHNDELLITKIKKFLLLPKCELFKLTTKSQIKTIEKNKFVEKLYQNKEQFQKL